MKALRIGEATLEYKEKAVLGAIDELKRYLQERIPSRSNSIIITFIETRIGGTALS